MSTAAGPKKSLGTVVECPESSVEDAATAASAAATDSTKTRPRKEDRRRTLGGSRLSLASLFSFSSQGRDRSRSGWSSTGDEGATGRAMSVSTSDLRSPNPGSTRRVPMDAEEVIHLDEACGEDDACAMAAANGIRRNCKTRECPLCYLRQPLHNFPRLSCCSHRSCRFCLMQYVELEIMENRVEVSCPECSEHLHPSDVHLLLGSHNELMDKYENFSLRRYLMTEPDTRWCPAPDCTYAVIATACAACPQLRCEREECGTLFCYHCKGVWHANQTCDEARRQRAPNAFRQRISALGSIDASLKPGDIKACPRCRTYIVKMDDGSCNHMVCAMCSAEFCWLCLKEISDLHYLSPTGCTFWGKKPWTRKKKLLWQLGTLVGAPVGIALIAGLSIPGIIFGVPVFVGRKVHQRFMHHTKAKRRLVTAACVAGSLIVSPVLAVMAVGVGVPIMLAYVYGVVPLSLCRNGGCGLSDNGTNAAADQTEDEDMWNMTNVFMDGLEKSQLLSDAERVEATSIIAGLSVNSGLSTNANGGRLSVVADNAHRRRHSVESGVTSLGERINYEEASTKAMAGSHYYYDDKSVHTVCSGVEAVSYCDEVASTKALAGSVLDSKSLSDSLGGRVHFSTAHQVAEATVAEDKPCSSHAFDEPSFSGDEHAGTSMMYRKRTCRPVGSLVGTQVHHSVGGDGDEGEDVLLMSAEAAAELEGPDSEVTYAASTSNDDPYRLRALFDTMKQMVSVEESTRGSANLMNTPHNVLDGLPARNPRMPLRRTGSARAMSTSLIIRERGDGPSASVEHARSAPLQASSEPPGASRGLRSSAATSKPAKRRFFGLFSSKK